MTATDRAVQVLRDTLERIWGYDAPDWADDIAADLRDAGLITPEPRIIRTSDELAALDPDTMLEDTDGSTYVAQEAQKNPSDLDLYADDLPAVVIAHGDEYRAARRALEDADGTD